MGVVQVGLLNKKVRVVPRTPLSAQFADVFYALTDASAKDGTLLLHLRQFSFAELTGALSEKGYCHLRAGLYAKENDRYRFLEALDTVILVNAIDVTRALFRKGSNLASDFIGKNLSGAGADDVRYSYEDLLKLDSIEKSRITAYNTETFTDGLYVTYESFKNQIPDKPIIVEKRKGEIYEVKSPNGRGKAVYVHRPDIYAIVHEGQPYIATKYDYYPLRRVNGDFIFTGRARVTAGSGDVMAASLFFGILGGLLASNADAVFDMQLDHLSGEFIQIREVKEERRR